MATVTNVPVTTVPAEGDTTFPALDSVTTFDLVGPVAANRQPVSLKTRDATLRLRVNELVGAVNDIGQGGAGTTVKFLPRDGTNAMTGALAMGASKITGLAAAAAGTDAMNRDAGDARWLALSGGTMAGAIAMGANKITGIGASGAATDAIQRQELKDWLKLIVKPSYEEVQNSAVLQNDNHLFFSIGAGELWTFRFQLLVRTGVTENFKFEVDTPATTSGRLHWSSWDPGAESTLENGLAATNAEVSPVNTGTQEEALLRIEGHVVDTGSGGTVRLKWAQATSGAHQTRVLAGSALSAIHCGA